MKKQLLVTFVMLVAFTNHSFAQKAECVGGLYNTFLGDDGLEGTDIETVTLKKNTGSVEFDFTILDRSFKANVQLFVIPGKGYWSEDLITMHTVFSESTDGSSKEVLARDISNSKFVANAYMLKQAKLGKPKLLSHMPLWSSRQTLMGSKDPEILNLIFSEKIHEAMELGTAKGLLPPGNPYRLEVICDIR